MTAALTVLAAGLLFIAPAGADPPSPLVQVELSPPSISPSGTDTTLATVTLVDEQGHLLGGHTVILQAGDTGAVRIGPVTDHGNGTYTATITGSLYAGPVDIAAWDSNRFGTTSWLYGTATLDQPCPSFCPSAFWPIANRPVRGDAQIAIAFTSTPDKKSLKKAITLGNGGSKPLRGTVTMDPNNPTVVDFTPTAFLDHGKTYTVHVVGGDVKYALTDTSRRKLYLPLDQSFTIEEDPPSLVSQPGTVPNVNPANPPPLEFMFSEPIRPDILKSKAVTFLQIGGDAYGRKVSFSMKLRNSGRILSVTVKSKLRYGNTYRLTIPGGVDAGGNPRGIVDTSGNPFPFDVRAWLAT